MAAMPHANPTDALLARAAPTAHDWSHTSLAYFKLTRLHKFPAGADVTFWPGVWAVAMIAYISRMAPEHFALQSILYLVGCTMYHSAGCIWNDICDRDYDKLVERTKTRPLASGRVSVYGALVLMVFLLAICGGLLVFAGQHTFKLAAAGVSLVAIYPTMKRWTYWPQALLGAAIAWALPIAWVSNLGYNAYLPATTLFAGCICWTLHYDTIYACQDRLDDIQAGIKSTAVLFGSHVRAVLALFASLFVLSLVITGRSIGYGPSYYYISVGGAAAHLTWQLWTVDFDDPSHCWRMFQANGTGVGFIVWFGMFAEYLRSHFIA